MLLRPLLLFRRATGHATRKMATASGADTGVRRPTGRISVAQMTATADEASNLAVARTLAERAKAEESAMLCLPECFSFIGSHWTEVVSHGSALEGPRMQEYRDLAREVGIWLSLGGFHEKAPVPTQPQQTESDANDGKRNEEGQRQERVFNTHVIIDDHGEVRAAYRKIHLFDVEIPNGPVYKESRYTAPGDELVLVDSPVGRLGLSTCYDVRFPEMYTELARRGAELILVPSAFTVPTGRAGHWEVLLRARAIETQCYVLAPAQVGQHNEKRASWGHALVIDPMGQVLHDAVDESPALLTQEIDLQTMHEQTRVKMPIQQHRRIFRSFFPDDPEHSADQADVDAPSSDK